MGSLSAELRCRAESRLAHEAARLLTRRWRIIIHVMTTQILKPKKKPVVRRGSNGRSHPGRIADIVINGSVHIPPWVTDHDSFRRWARSDNFPQRGQFFFLNGELWVDLSMEKLIHNQIKAAFSMVLGAIAFNETLGRFFGDGMMLTNLAAGLSCEPDGMFVANATFLNGGVTVAEGDDSLEVIGTPDMALEVVSKSSVVRRIQSATKRCSPKPASANTGWSIPPWKARTSSSCVWLRANMSRCANKTAGPNPMSSADRSA